MKFEGLADASVRRGIEGYGASSRIRTVRLLSLSGDLSVAVIRYVGRTHRPVR